MTQKTKRHIIASVGTAIFMIVLFLLLWFIYLTAVVPEQEEGLNPLHRLNRLLLQKRNI